MSKHEAEKERVEQNKESKTGKTEGLTEEARTGMETHNDQLTALRKGIKDGTIEPKISSNPLLGFDKTPTIFESGEKDLEREYTSRNLVRLDSGYVQESKKELEKILHESGPKREADLARWLDKQSANTDPEEAASGLTPEERKEL